VSDNLKKAFVDCRDALACAVNWAVPFEDEPSEDVHVPEIPQETIDWLMKRLDAATTLADKLVAESDEEG